MKLFTYRGIRVRAFYRHIRGITWFIWWFPSLLAIGHYCYLNLEELKEHLYNWYSENENNEDCYQNVNIKGDNMSFDATDGVIKLIRIK